MSGVWGVCSVDAWRDPRVVARALSLPPGMAQRFEAGGYGGSSTESEPFDDEEQQAELQAEQQKEQQKEQQAEKVQEGNHGEQRQLQPMEGDGARQEPDKRQQEEVQAPKQLQIKIREPKLQVEVREPKLRMEAREPKQQQVEAREFKQLQMEVQKPKQLQVEVPGPKQLQVEVQKPKLQVKDREPKQQTWGGRGTEFPAESVVDGARAKLATAVAVTDSDSSVGNERPPVTNDSRSVTSAGVATAFRKAGSRQPRGLSVSFAEEVDKREKERERLRKKAPVKHRWAGTNEQRSVPIESRRQDVLLRDDEWGSSRQSDDTHCGKYREKRYRYDDEEQKDLYGSGLSHRDEYYRTYQQDRCSPNDLRYAEPRHKSPCEYHLESPNWNSDGRRNNHRHHHHRQETRPDVYSEPTLGKRPPTYSDHAMLREVDRAPSARDTFTDLSHTNRKVRWSAPAKCYDTQGDRRPHPDYFYHFQRSSLGHSADKPQQDWRKQNQDFRQKRPDPVSTHHTEENSRQQSDFQQQTSYQHPTLSLLSPRDPRRTSWLSCRDPRLVNQGQLSRGAGFNLGGRDRSWSEQQEYHSGMQPSSAFQHTRSVSLDMSAPAVQMPQQDQTGSSWLDRFGTTSSTNYDPRTDQHCRYEDRHFDHSPLSLRKETTHNAFFNDDHLDSPLVPVMPPRPSHRLKIKGVRENCILRIQRFKISSRYVEEELQTATNQGEIDHLLGKQKKLRAIKQQLVSHYPNNFQEVFDAIKITPAEMEQYRYRKAFSCRVNTYRNDQKMLDAHGHCEDSRLTQDNRRRQEELNAVRDALVQENERLFHNVMGMMEKTEVFSHSKHPTTPVQSAARRLAHSDPSSSSPKKKKPATPYPKMHEESSSQPYIRHSKEKDDSYACKVQRFKITSEFVAEEVEHAQTQGERTYLQRRKETLKSIRNQLIGSDPGRFQAAYNAATVTKDDIQRYRATKMFCRRVMRYKREEDYLQQQQAAVDKGNEANIESLKWRHHHQKRTREQLIRENETLFWQVMTKSEEGRTQKREHEDLRAESSGRRVKQRRL